MLVGANALNHSGACQSHRHIIYIQDIASYIHLTSMQSAFRQNSSNAFRSGGKSRILPKPPSKEPAREIRSLLLSTATLVLRRLNGR